MKKKRCHYCQSYFIPHPCVGQRQEACRKIQCQKARKAQNNREWRKKNPDCYNGDYPRIKKWLNNHPGYLKKYRQNHPEYREKNRKSQSMRDRSKKLCLDIQAELRGQRTEIIDQLWNHSDLDIQAELNLQPIEIMFLFSHLLNLDIQADLDRYKPILRR
jgi:NAD+--asparagine ADP-ribosyltransferase